MQINLLNNPQINNKPLYQNKQCYRVNSSDTVSFSGLHNKEDEALFVFDLDGSFANGTNEDIQKVLEIQKQSNAVLAYATGQTKKDFEKLQNELKCDGIILPTPQHLITNNGQFVYEKNTDGELVEDINWRTEIKENTGFDRDAVCTIIKDIAHRPEYRHSQSEVDQLKEREDFELRKQEDPDFWDSKISYYEWNPSEHMIEYFVSSDVDIEKLQRTINEELNQQGIKTKFILNKYSKKIMNKCDANLIRQSRPLRENSEGTMTSLFVCPADKADGIKFVSEKLGIPNSEIAMAGNEINDISMANLTKRGAFFICLGNASKALREHVEKIKTEINNRFPNNLISTEKEGASGILEGINRILSINSNI